MNRIITFGITLLISSSLAINCEPRPSGTPCQCISSINLLTDAVKSKCQVTDPPQGRPSCSDAECIARENGLYSGSTFSRDLLKSKWENAATSAEMKTAVTNAYSTCDSRVGAGVGDCPVGKFMFCMKHETMKNAPDSAWSTTDSCAQWKEHVKSCPPPGPPMGNGNGNGNGPPAFG